MLSPFHEMSEMVIIATNSSVVAFDHAITRRSIEMGLETLMYTRFHEMSEMVICATNSFEAVLSTIDHAITHMAYSEGRTRTGSCGERMWTQGREGDGHGAEQYGPFVVIVRSWFRI
jgi:hypothetical protein